MGVNFGNRKEGLETNFYQIETGIQPQSTTQRRMTAHIAMARRISIFEVPDNGTL